MSGPLVWTSTQFQNWKTDCTKHMGSHLPFELQDVYRPEYETFCVNLCEQHRYTWELQGHTIVCTPPVSAGSVAG
jgi:hypothetical protein